MDNYEGEYKSMKKQFKRQDDLKLKYQMSCFLPCNFLTSRANTASGAAVESMHEALIEITKWPPFFKK